MSHPGPTEVEQDSTVGLPMLPGIDTAIGLVQVRGNVAFYTRLLKKFRDNSMKSFVADFRAARNAADWPTAARLAHSMKGVALALGATVLGKIAEKLELAAREQRVESFTLLETEMDEALKLVIEGLSTLDEVGIVPAEIHPIQRQANFVTLARLLQERDTAATTFLEDFNRSIGDAGDHAELVAELNSDVTRYNYGEALKKLQQLASHYDITLDRTPDDVNN